MADIIVKELRVEDRINVGTLIFECWGEEFAYLSESKEKIASVLSSFPTHRFFGAYCEEELVGILGYADSSGRACKFDRRIFQNEFGFLKSITALLDMGYGVNSLSRYPLVKKGEASLLEYIGVKSEFRGQGAATMLIKHAINNLPFRKFFIEVFEANKAVDLYRRLGFKQLKRRKVLSPPQKNYTHILLLEYDKP